MKQITWNVWVRFGAGLSGSFIEDITIYDCSQKPGYRRGTVSLDEAAPVSSVEEMRRVANYLSKVMGLHSAAGKLLAQANQIERASKEL